MSSLTAASQGPDPADQDHSHGDLEQLVEIVEYGAESTGSTSSTSTTSVEGSTTSTATKIEAVRLVTISGDQGIDGLLWKYCWDDGSISYCDPNEVADYNSPYPKALTTTDAATGATTNHLSQLSPQQLATARFALDADPTGVLTTAAGFSVEGFTNLSISYAGSGSGSGTIAIASHSSTSTATAYMPHSGVSGSGGDAFFGGSGAAPVAGNYHWHTMLHELGHTLGLKHGQETDPFGAMPAHLDSMEYSVMTYRSYVGDVSTGYNNESLGYAQTYMMYDIAALQHMYGADLTTNAGNTVYTWRPDSGDTWIDGKLAIDAGGTRIFLTIWDGGGVDTYDLSAYTTKLSIDLNPGSHSVFSTAQLADLDTSSTDPARVARGNVFNALLYKDNSASLIENAIGGSGDDSITGNRADNHLTGGKGNDTLNGGTGKDILVGGLGKDSLFGGIDSDADLFVFASRYDSAVGLNRDTVSNFTRGLDDIDLSGIDARASTTTNEAFSYNYKTSKAYAVWWTATTDGVLLRGDVTGDRTADFEILVKGVTALGADDLLL